MNCIRTSGRTRNVISACRTPFDARLHLILFASKRSALRDVGCLFLNLDPVIVSYKIEWWLLVC